MSLPTVMAFATVFGCGWMVCATALAGPHDAPLGAPHRGDERLAYVHPTLSPVGASASTALVASVAEALAAVRPDEGASTDGGAGAPTSSPTRKRFGEAGALRLNLLGSYADNFHDAEQFGGGVGMSYFIVDDFSIDLELLGWGFSQRGSDAAGGNLNLLFRWHFLRRGPFTLYGDAGAGILITTDDVPYDGSPFNFTPQAGVGASWEFGDDVHLLVGLRWHHISNARIYSDNPARDSLQIYAGISLPLR